jgi:hypothetical protein
MPAMLSIHWIVYGLILIFNFLNEKSKKLSINQKKLKLVFIKIY